MASVQICMDLEVPNYLLMPRKSFEFGQVRLKNPEVEKITARLLDEVWPHENGQATPVDRFWAREHACYLVYGHGRGIPYRDYLPGRHYTYVLVADLVRRHLPEGGEGDQVILEAGCGSAIASAYLCGRARRAYCVDRSACALRFAGTLADDLKVKLNTIQADVMEMAFSDASFTASFSLGVLEHYAVSAQCAIIREMARVTTGFVVVIVPNTSSSIYQSMEEAELALAGPHFRYPDQSDQFEVDFSAIAKNLGLDLVEEGGLHIAPPRTIKKRHLTSQAFAFFTQLLADAARSFDGDAASTWLQRERKCTPDDLRRYGWFTYAVFRGSARI